MITKVIHSRFELDLGNVKTTHVEENNWLNDQVRSKYTYPVEIDLTPEQVVAFNHINELNLRNPTALFEVQFYTMGEKHDAFLEIKKMKGNRANIEIRYGFEEFPNFSKPLSQLPLEYIDLEEESMFDYAETIIPQAYPDVNFNFPQVITDLVDVNSDQWELFQGIVNNYVSGSGFLLNEYDAIEDVAINRNILQPLPYLMHILKKGFEDAGYILAGEILEDEYFKKATIYALSEYYSAANGSQTTESLYTNEYTGMPPNPESGQVTGIHGQYSKNIAFPEPGRYKIAGNVYFRTYGSFFNSYIYNKFEYNGDQIWFVDTRVPAFNLVRYKENQLSIDFNLDWTGTEGDLTFESHNLLYGIVDGEQDYEVLILDVTVTQLAKFDGSGELVTTVVDPGIIDLTKCVPDMNFGPFVNAFAKWHNYGIDPIGNTVYMNKLKKIVTTSNDALDLQPFEVKFPLREFNQGKTYVLSFFDTGSEDYDFKKLLITKEDYQVSPFAKPEDATEIMIDALPLPLKQFGGVVTAHGFLDDNTKPQVVLYEGLTGGLNVSESAEGMSVLNSYLNHHKEWIDFLINSMRFSWSFTSFIENILKLKIKSIVYAYGQFHIIRRLTRKKINDNIVDIEIETESLH